MNRRHVPLLLAASLAVVLTACQPKPPATNVEEIKKAIAAANAQQVQAFQSKDIEGMTKNYAPDAVVLPQHSPMISGKDAMHSFFEGMTRDMGNDFTFSMTKFDASGDIAYEFGNYSGSFAGVADKGKYLTVWKKQSDGKWMIAADIFNTDLPPMAMPTPEPEKKGKK